MQINDIKKTVFGFKQIDKMTRHQSENAKRPSAIVTKNLVKRKSTRKSGQKLVKKIDTPSISIGDLDN